MIRPPHGKTLGTRVQSELKAASLDSEGSFKGSVTDYCRTDLRMYALGAMNGAMNGSDSREATHNPQKQRHPDWEYCASPQYDHITISAASISKLRLVTWHKLQLASGGLSERWKKHRGSSLTDLGAVLCNWKTPGL